MDRAGSRRPVFLSQKIASDLRQILWSAMVGLVRQLRPCLALVAFALTYASAALAQDIAPGPMSRGHDHLTGPLSCAKCHEGGGVPDKKCLGCHDHANLRSQIEAAKGFHSNEDVKSKPCKECHLEHREDPPGSNKGRRTTVDWRPYGGQRNFEHQRTGWPLEGAHKFQKCEKCHTKKSTKTDTVIYLGASPECASCHKNPHQFDDPRLNDCLICHNYSNREVRNLGATKFDHDKTKFPLDGLHLKRECKECHVKTDKFTISDKDFSDCKGCHEDSHKSVISKSKKKCGQCHATKTKFQLTKFDHDKETRWPIRGKHQKNVCKDCHKVGSEPVAPEMKCVACHEDVHKGRFGKETCEGCHSEAGWFELAYAHDRKTKFDLTGAHAKAKCVDCHRKREPNGFEKLPESNIKDCAGCHEHAEAHCGQFGMENCQRCHARGGDRSSRFDHSLTRFPLIGAHAKPGCDKCHLPAKLGESPECRRATKYTGSDVECLACHEDVHKGDLGKDCSKCHSAGREFKSLVFDHNRDSKFPLTGYHQLVECESCHPKRKYKLEETACKSCHLEDDVHEKILGDDCVKCHDPAGGARNFDHDVLTKFPLSGVHLQVECARCHFLPPPDQRDRLSVVAPPGAPLDLQFRSGGKECVDCHPDPHQVRVKETRPDPKASPDSRAPSDFIKCDRCHQYETWKAPNRNAYHERAGFSLTGAHTVLECRLCHNGSGRMTGRGETCGKCHTQDDVHAGSFGPSCGECHEQNQWLPTTFSHMTTGFVLEGVHRMIDCRSCHQAGNYFIGRRCYHCHLGDFQAAQWHQTIDLRAQLQNGDAPKVFVGTPAKTVDCGECHNQFDFFKATYTTPKADRNK